MLLRGGEKGDDADCEVAEVDAVSGVDDGPLKKHDSVFMRNVHIFGSNLTVRFFARSKQKFDIFSEGDGNGVRLDVFGEWKCVHAY